VAAALLDGNPSPRRLTLSSPVCSSEVCFTSVPSRTERIVGDTLFASLSRYPFLWSESELGRIAAEAQEWQPQFLDVDPVYGMVFARYCEQRALRFPSLRFVLSSYEFLSVNHRRVLQRAFGVPVFDLYGSTETGHLLMENERSEMRPSLETAFLEVIHPDAQGIGELVVTTLSNPLMPLLRYRIGDLVQRLEQPQGTRYLLHGRAADAFVTESGRRVTARQVDQLFADRPGIAHYQLIQRRDEPWVVRYVPDVGGPEPHDLAALAEKLASSLELNVPPVFQVTDMLVPEGSGKFRLACPQQNQRGFAASQ
jgi:phenylacetate-CoA ligase